MDFKYCSGCLRDLPLSSFLAADGLGDRIFATCISCRNKQSSRRSENRGKIGKGESQTEAGKETARVQKELEGRQRRGLEKSKKNRV
jgi:hypothetical protein